MAASLRELRRGATQLAIQQAITATSALPIGVQQSAVGSLVTLVGSAPTLRRKVRENMRLALGHEPPARAEDAYFRRVGWILSRTLPIYHRGIDATSVPREVFFDDTARILDDAVAEGRGVVFTSAHWSGQEAVAAIIGRRHRMAMLVRQASTSESTNRKLKWYNALGVETVLRPSQASTIKDAVAYLKILKSGKLLAITPDLLADPGQGVEARLFGRPVRLHGGAFALAISAKAPMIRVSARWHTPSSVTAVFDRATLALDAGDRDAAISAGVQDWCLWFERKLEANPENWLFWLDKRWSRFLHETSRTSGAG